MGIFSKLFSKLFGNNDDEHQRQVQQVRQQIEETLDGQIITDDETGEAFQVEVLPQMSYEDFIALCESLKGNNQ